MHNYPFQLMREAFEQGSATRGAIRCVRASNPRHRDNGTPYRYFWYLGKRRISAERARTILESTIGA